MNAQSKNLNSDNAEAVKQHIPLMAYQNMGAELKQLVLQELRDADGPWASTPEKKQHVVLERVDKRITYLVAQAVNTIISHGHVSVAATIDSVNLKDKIKLTAFVARGNHEESLAALYRAGAEAPCMIVLGTAEDYLGGMAYIKADPDQPQLFEPEIPSDQMLWGLSIPTVGGGNLVPVPSRKDALLYAQSIQERFLTDENKANHELASQVYARPWDQSPGAYNRALARGDWEATINWFSKLCAGEIEVTPIVALIEYVPQVETEGATDPEILPEGETPTEPAADEPSPEESQDESFHTPESVQFDEPQPDDLDDGIAIIETVITPEQAANPIIATVRLKNSQYVAEYLGHEAKSKISAEVALSLLSNKLGLTGNISHDEVTTEQDEIAQVRRFTIKADQE